MRIEAFNQLCGGRWLLPLLLPLAAVGGILGRRTASSKRPTKQIDGRPNAGDRMCIEVQRRRWVSSTSSMRAFLFLEAISRFPLRCRLVLSHPIPSFSSRRKRTPFGAPFQEDRVTPNSEIWPPAFGDNHLRKSRVSFGGGRMKSGRCVTCIRRKRAGKRRLGERAAWAKNKRQKGEEDDEERKEGEEKDVEEKDE